MIHNLNSIIRLLRRRNNASKLGIVFERSKNFKFPKKILFNNNYVELKVPHEGAQVTAFIEIFLDDCYGLKKLKKSHANIKNIIDIGGNIGLFSVASRIIFPDANIFSFEPNKNIEKFLKYHSDEFNFSYFNKAVSNSLGRISLNLKNESVLVTSINDEKGSIEKTTLKEIFKKIKGNIDLLKMDCEGAEWEILWSDIDWNKIRNISFEYHLFKEKETLNLLKERLNYLGYKINFLQVCGNNYGLIRASKKK